jgi:OFA family oxalate/formate antiporter-like MFS transporter
MLVGIVYAWSIIKVPFEAHWDAAQLGLNYTLTIIFFCIGGFLSGLFSKKVSSSVRIMISGIFIFIGFFITSRLDGGSIIPLYLAYGVLTGLGIGITYITIISTTNAWFPDRQGLCSGILLTGFGSSSLIIGRIADTMGRSEQIGWSNTYIFFAILIGVVLLIAGLMVKPPPEGTAFPEPKIIKKADPQNILREVTLSQMVKLPSFYISFLILSFFSFSGMASISFARNILLDVGASVGFAVTVVGLLAVANGIGRLVAGWLFDNLGITKTRYVYSACGLIAPVVLTVALLTDSLFLGVIGMCLQGFSFGFTPTCVSVFTLRFFGAKNFTSNYGLMNMVLIPASLTATLAGVIKDATGEFTLAFLIISVFALIAAVMNIVHERYNKRKLTETNGNQRKLTKTNENQRKLTESNKNQ